MWLPLYAHDAIPQSADYCGLLTFCHFPQSAIDKTATCWGFEFLSSFRTP